MTSPVNGTSDGYHVNTVVCVRCRRTVDISITRVDDDTPTRRRCKGTMAYTCGGFELARIERASEYATRRHSHAHVRREKE